MASGGHSSSRCTGPSPSRPLLLRSTGSRRTGSVVVAHGPSRSAARGILPDQGSNLCALHWQADSQPLRHQGSPHEAVFDIGQGQGHSIWRVWVVCSPVLCLLAFKLSTIRQPIPMPLLALSVVPGVSTMYRLTFNYSLQL